MIYLTIGSLALMLVIGTIIGAIAPVKNHRGYGWGKIISATAGALAICGYLVFLTFYNHIFHPQIVVVIMSVIGTGSAVVATCWGLRAQQFTPGSRLHLDINNERWDTAQQQDLRARAEETSHTLLLLSVVFAFTSLAFDSAIKLTS